MDTSPVPEPVAAYLARIGRIPLLTAAQEAALGRRVQAGLASGEAGVVADGRLAHADLVSANLRLVVALARSVPAGGTPFLDLVQEGNLALMRAADRFDPDRGFRFSTFAHPWIAETLRAASGGDRALRLPPRAAARLAHCRRARDELRRGGLDDPRPADVARATGLALSEVHRLLRAEQNALPLEVADLLAGPDDPAVPTERSDRRLRVRVALERLDPPERRVLELRFGLAGEPCSRREAARRTGFGTGRVRRLEQRGLARLRDVVGIDGLR